MNDLRYTETETPLGRVLILHSSRGLKGVWFHGQKHYPAIPGEWHRDDAGLADIAARIRSVISGYADDYTGDLAPEGTDFQQQVWRVLRAIPRGEVITYAEVARRVGRPSAVRAVGSAIGRNPLSVIVPCHRVIGSSGSLTGYAGGLDRKQRLLDMERPTLAPS